MQLLDFFEVFLISILLSHHKISFLRLFFQEFVDNDCKFEYFSFQLCCGLAFIWLEKVENGMWVTVAHLYRIKVAFLPPDEG